MLVLLGLGFEAIGCNLQGVKSRVKTGCLADDRVTGPVDQHHTLICQIPVSCQDRDHGREQRPREKAGSKKGTLGESLLLRTGSETQVIKEGSCSAGLVREKQEKRGKIKTAGNRKERSKEGISVPEHRTASPP